MATYCPNPRTHQDYIPSCRLCSEECHEEKDCSKNSLNLATAKGKQGVDDEGLSTSTNLVEIVTQELSNERPKQITFSQEYPMVSMNTYSVTKIGHERWLHK